MEVKVKLLNEKAVIPKYAKEGDAGMDLTAVSMEYNQGMDAYIYGTGIALEIPKGYVGLIFPRSSNRKTDAYLTNHVGVIDSGYRGEVMLTFKDRTEMCREVPYKVGDRIGQIIILPYPKIDFIESVELSETERGEGGHGSTGN